MSSLEPASINIGRYKPGTANTLSMSEVISARSLKQAEATKTP